MDRVAVPPSVSMAWMKSNRARVLFVVVSVCALASLRAMTGPEGAGRDPATRALSIFSEVFSLTRTNYVEPTDSKTLLEGAYDGMSDALDPSRTTSPRAPCPRTRRNSRPGRPLRASSSRAAAAIPFVVAPLPGVSGREGRRQGRRSHRFHRRKADAQRAVWKINAALEGPEGSTCELTVFRGGEEKKLTVSVPRRRFEPPAPSTKWERDVAILRIPTFTPARRRRSARSSTRHPGVPSPASSSTCGDRSAGAIPGCGASRRALRSTRDPSRPCSRARTR